MKTQNGRITRPADEDSVMQLYLTPLLFSLAWLYTCAALPKAIAQMSADQARRILLRHIQTPDATLRAEVVFDIGGDGHLEFLFYGDKGGTYRIDAVCGAKLIVHARRSPVEIWEKPAKTLAPSQLDKIAADYVAAHFPGYKKGMFKVSSGKDDGGTYCLYDVNFIREVPSGAEIPVKCSLEVEEDTGAVSRYQEYSLPITINTDPKLNSAQAIAAGQEWIRQNVSLNPETARVSDPPELYPVRLKVDVDPLLNQTLLYEIRYRAMVLQVDAQTGAVISHDLYAHDDEGPRQSWGKGAKNPETLWEVRFPNGHTLTHEAIAVSGAVFVWHRYARAVGIAVRQGSESVELACRDKRIRLPLVSENPGATEAAWLMKGELYLPVAALLQLTDRIRVDQMGQSVTLSHPYAHLSSPRRSTGQPVSHKVARSGVSRSK
jgi:hypothetical protein